MNGQKFRAGLVQMCSGRDVERNIADASALIREAAVGGREVALSQTTGSALVNSVELNI